MDKKEYDELWQERDRLVSQLRQVDEPLKEEDRRGFTNLILRRWKAFKYPDIRYTNCLEDVVPSITESLVDDLFRLASYHDTKHGADDPKKAAYLGKWILKFRPLYYVEAFDRNLMTNDHHRINEAFALDCMLTLVGDVAPPSGKLLEELLYTLRFRPYSEAGITMLLRALQRRL